MEDSHLCMFLKGAFDLSYRRSDVVVQALHEAGDDPHRGQRSFAHFVLLEELPDGIAAHV